MAPLPDHPRGRPTVTTNRKPYDLTVAAILLCCALLPPQVFTVASDATWAEWGTPVALYLPRMPSGQVRQVRHLVTRTHRG
jgi:hypothetical protein